MSDDISIPKEALEAARVAMKEAVGAECLDATEERAYRLMARAACLAMLRAWPGMDIADDDDWCAIRKGWITLPQENTNAEG